MCLILLVMTPRSPRSTPTDPLFPNSTLFRSQEERQQRQPGGERVEVRFDLGIVEDLIGREQHHRRLEEVIVEGAEKLRDEKRQETALLEQPERTDHGN